MDSIAIYTHCNAHRVGAPQYECIDTRFKGKLGHCSSLIIFGTYIYYIMYCIKYV